MKAYICLMLGIAILMYLVGAFVAWDWNYIPYAHPAARLFLAGAWIAIALILSPLG